eukprot:261935-Amphidinium_carterae.1
MDIASMLWASATLQLDKDEVPKSPAYNGTAYPTPPQTQTDQCYVATKHHIVQGYCRFFAHLLLPTTGVMRHHPPLQVPHVSMHLRAIPTGGAAQVALE